MAAAVLLISGLLACAARQGAATNIADAELSARQVPTVEQFQIGPGDKIAITVWRHEDLSMEVTVAPDGTISFPLVGTLPVAGKTYSELREMLTSAIQEYYTNPQVAVNIVELQNQKVIIVGEVTRPSVLQLTGEMSVVEALTLAGGINQYARTNNVLLVRAGKEGPELYTVDVDSIFSEGAGDQLVMLQRGDIVVVPTRTITNAARFFKDVSSVLAPFVAGSAVYRNALSGGAQGTAVLE